MIFWKRKKNEFIFFLFSFRNNHIVLAICCAHPLNPNSRNSRFLAFLSSNAFALFLACLAPFLLKGQSQVTVILLEYVVFALLETIVDIQSQTLASCSCCHRDGVPVSDTIDSFHDIKFQLKPQKNPLILLSLLFF